MTIGVDLGGTHLRMSAFRGDTQVLNHREVVGQARDPESMVRRIAAFAESAAPTRTPIGIGLAAMLRGHDGMVAHPPHLKWRDVPFGAMLRDRLPNRRIAVFNDVNAVTYGEYRAGAGRGARNLVAVFVGTGIGGGIIADGTLLTGASNTCAEVGHLKVVLGPKARPCNCGLRGCVEAYAGGTYLLSRVCSELQDGARSLASELAGGSNQVTPAHVDEAAGRGDPYASEQWREIAPLLGAGLANLATTLNPERLILGGGVLSRAPMLRAMAEESCRKLTNPPALADLDIVDAELGDRAGVVGAVLLVRAVGR